MKEWERQKGESSKSFAWFKIYRNLGPLRTFQKVIDYIENQPKQTKTLPNNQNKLPTPTVNKLKNLSYKWEWSKRCTAWDNYHDEQEQLQYNEAYKKTKDRLIDMGNDILDVTENILDELNDDERSQATSKAHAVKSLSDSFEKTTKTIRLLYGKSTEIKDGKTEVNAEVEAKVEKDTRLETSQNIIMDPEFVKLSQGLLEKYSEQ
jgi:methionine synthase II (cobalamin-independent)